MRQFFIILSIVIIAIAVNPASSYAGWSEDIRLTYRGEEYHPQVIAQNDTIHVVWQTDIGGYISYIRSSDGGETWDSLINISEEGHTVSRVDFSLGENGLFVSWEDSDPLIMIAYSMSVDGSEWTPPTYLPTDHIDDIFVPASAVLGDSIFIAYFSLERDSTGNKPIQFFSSYDYGQTWNDEVTVSYQYSTQQELILTRCGTNLLLAKSGFVDSLHSGYHIVGYRSDDGGQSWSDLIWISPEHWYSAQDFCTGCNDETGQLAVGYMDYRYQEYAFFGDIFVAISNDGGLTWPREVRSTQYPTATAPEVDFGGDTLVVVWSDRRFGSPDPREIFYNRSNDLGMTWIGEDRLTNDLYFSSEPWISFGDAKVHVVWRNSDEFNGNDIYYKRFTPETTSIRDVDIQIPEDIILKTYPNPFNSSLKIMIEVNSSGVLGIYNILGELIKEYSYEESISGITWDAVDGDGKPVSAGVYFIKAKDGNNHITRKLVYLK